MRQKITDVAIEIMKKNGDKHIGYESFGLLDDVYFECLKRKIIRGIGSNGGKTYNYPPNRHQVVLNALDRDSRFRKWFMRCCGGRENAECLVRMFELTTPNLNTEDKE